MFAVSQFVPVGQLKRERNYYKCQEENITYNNGIHWMGLFKEYIHSAVAMWTSN